MADTKLTDLPLLDAVPADDDQLYIVDVSDTTDDADGSSKRVAASRFVRGTTSGFSVLGKSTTGAGAPASIVASADQVLRRSGSGNLVFGTLVTNNIGNQQITFAKLLNGPSQGVIGRSDSGPGSYAHITSVANAVLSNSSDTGVTAFHKLTAAMMDDSIVSNAKLANMAQARIKGRAAGAGTGTPVDLTAEQVSAILGPTPIADGSVTNAKLANMATQTIKGRTSAGTGSPQDLTPLLAQQIIFAMTRQGGDATNWQTSGTSSQTMTTTRIQIGAVPGPGSVAAETHSSLTVTFPTAFSGRPITIATADSAYFTVGSFSVNNSSVSIRFRNNSSISRELSFINWIAIGPV